MSRLFILLFIFFRIFLLLWCRYAFFPFLFLFFPYSFYLEIVRRGIKRGMGKIKHTLCNMFCICLLRKGYKKRCKREMNIFLILFFIISRTGCGKGYGRDKKNMRKANNRRLSILFYISLIILGISFFIPFFILSAKFI